MIACVFVRNRDRVCAGRHGCTAAVGAVFQDHHYRRLDAEPFGGEQIDLRIWLAALDIFGKSAERKMERKLIDEYEATVKTLLNSLSPDNHALAVEIATIPDAIRGYGHIKEKAIAEAKAKEAALLKAWHDPSKAGLWSARAAAE